MPATAERLYYQHPSSPKPLPVPWIIRWTDELTAEPAGVHPYRTPWGMIGVHQEGGTAGKGEPQWANVSSWRAFLSCTHGLCQVCGQSGGVLWRLPPGLTPEEMIAREDTSVLTEAPTGLCCIRTADRLCPALNVRPTTWMYCEFISICGGAFGQPRTTNALDIMLPDQPNRVMPLAMKGLVLKQPYVQLRAIEVVTP